MISTELKDEIQASAITLANSTFELADLKPHVVPDLYAQTVDGYAKIFEYFYTKGIGADPTNMYWLGYKKGVERYSWISNGVRYVGAVAAPFNMLTQALKDIEQERQLTK